MCQSQPLMGKHVGKVARGARVRRKYSPYDYDHDKAPGGKISARRSVRPRGGRKFGGINFGWGSSNATSWEIMQLNTKELHSTRLQQMTNAAPKFTIRNSLNHHLVLLRVRRGLDRSGGKCLCNTSRLNTSPEPVMVYKQGL